MRFKNQKEERRKPLEDRLQRKSTDFACENTKASTDILSEISTDLGHGEREAIALALETRADLVVLDDQQGRNVSKNRNLQITGTIGVLIEAKERGFIHSLRHELDRLIEAGMWISEIFYHRILQELGE